MRKVGWSKISNNALFGAITNYAWDMMIASYLVCFVNSSLLVDQRTFFCATLQLFPSAAESLGKQFLYITKLN